MSGDLDRERPPDSGPLPPIRLPEFERFRLSNGLRLWVAEEDRVPEVSLRLVLEAGAAAEPEGEEGVAELTGRLLTEGAGSRDAQGMARWLDRLVARFDVSVGYDAAVVSLHLVSDVLTDALDYLRAAVREPRFEPDEVERVRQELLDEIERDRDEPDVVADVALIDLIYGAHRYGRPSRGIAETLDAADEGRVREFHEARYAARDAVVIAYGALEPEALREELEARFGDWREGGGRPGVPLPEGSGARDRVVVLDRPGSAQAEIRLGAVGAARSAADFYELVVGNAVLGGLFNSRVNMNLREEKGWTYGARTSFRFRRGRGPFVGSAAVETPAAAAALSEFLAEVRGMIRNPPTEDEVDLAKNALTLSLPRRFETCRRVTRRVATQAIHSLPEDYWEGYRSRIEAVTPASVEAAVERRLGDVGFTMTAAGDGDRIVPSLEEEFDEVEVRPF